jgi:hypothetical protein
MDIGKETSRAAKRSVTEPPATEKKAAEARPDRNRKAKMVPMFFAKALLGRNDEILVERLDCLTYSGMLKAAKMKKLTR